jgi:hypothetical protein
MYEIYINLSKPVFLPRPIITLNCEENVKNPCQNSEGLYLCMLSKIFLYYEKGRRKLHRADVQRDAMHIEQSNP